LIILDTNIVSELMRPTPNARVFDWVARNSEQGLFITSVSQAEILYGLELLSRGRKRDSLERAARTVFDELFGDRVLAFDGYAAPFFAFIAASRRSAGRPVGRADCQIAAIARVNTAAVATRDTPGFADCGVDLINPFEA
jgi:toxin FitB